MKLKNKKYGEGNVHVHYNRRQTRVDEARLKILSGGYMSLEKIHVCACIRRREIYNSEWACLDVTRMDDMQWGVG